MTQAEYDEWRSNLPKGQTAVVILHDGNKYLITGFGAKKIHTTNDSYDFFYVREIVPCRNIQEAQNILLRQ